MARLVFKPGAVHAFAQTRARVLVRNTSKSLTTQARRNAPGGPYSSGVLKSSIFWEFTRDSRWGVSSRIGSNLIYANSVHGGQPARTIVPVRAPQLVFFWRRAGRVVRRDSVSHPGTRAQPYLTDALLRIAPPRGFRVVIISD